MTDELELLRTPGEGMVSEEGERGVTGVFGPVPGMVPTMLTGTCHFAAYSTKKGFHSRVSDGPNAYRDAP